MKLKKDKSSNINKTLLQKGKSIVILGCIYKSIFSSCYLDNSCHFAIVVLAY